MASDRLDIRDLPPSQRHTTIHEAFDELDPGEELVIVNDHDPQPLFYEFRAERDAFDDEGYEVEQRGPEEFVATLPKRS
jgi:uncharacterized protein (DUF2249 family)